MSDVTIDKMCSDAKSFQDLLNTAKVENPAFANVLLGDAIAASKTNLGALIVGGLTLLSTRYGFGWSTETTDFTAGAVMIASSWAIHQWRVYNYRKTLPVVPMQTTPSTPA